MHNDCDFDAFLWRVGVCVCVSVYLYVLVCVGVVVEIQADAHRESFIEHGVDVCAELAKRGVFISLYAKDERHAARRRQVSFFLQTVKFLEREM